MSKKFWTEDIIQLVSFNKGLFPSSSLKLAENMNAISRISLIVCILIAIFQPVLAVSTFCITMALTMAIYYGVSDISYTGTRESYRDIESNKMKRDCMFNTQFDTKAALKYCKDRKIIPDDPDDYVSENQMLFGGQNPETLVPINNALNIRSHDFAYWKNVGPDLDVQCEQEYLKNSDLPDVKLIGSDIIPVNPVDVTDPRMTGHGPSNRCYIEDGQRKYFYDDVDSVRMPNFISRNKVDIYSWAPSYGSGYNGSKNSISGYSTIEEASKNQSLLDVKQKALSAYYDNTGRARQELQDSLMSKRNSEMWQMRLAPIY